MDCLEKCVRSVQNQTYDDLEIIIVDDGSTDDTGNLADELAKTDDKKRTVVYHKDNGGSSSARNLGILKASGDYLGFVDSDDFIDPQMYSRLAKVVEEEKVLIAQIGRDEIAADGSELESVVSIPDIYTEVSARSFIKELLLHKGDCSFCTKIVARQLFENASFPEGELNEDFWLLIQMLLSGKTELFVGVLPYIGYHVFYRETSNTRTLDRNVFPRVFTDIVVNANRVLEVVPKKYPDLLIYAERFSLVQHLDYIMHIPVNQMTRDNKFYIQVCDYLKSHKVQIRSNPYLTESQRNKLKLMATAPKFVRWVHLKKMELKGDI